MLGLAGLCFILTLLCDATPARIHVVPQCVGVTLNAAYLAQVTPGEGPGFLLLIQNDTDRLIKIARPFPSSAHWYAQATTGHWLWRSSSGSGGALANALSEHGPLVVYPNTGGSGTTGYLAVAPHAQLEAAESMRSNPVLRFRPGCERCKNPQDERYRAVLAYAYLPRPGQVEPGLLTCGLRSGPVVMPPLP